MVNSLLARAHREGTPLIDATHVTFLWEGRHPPFLKGDFTAWNVSDALQPRLIDEGVWRYDIDLPEDAYVEYAFFREAEGDDSRIPDPLNPRSIFNGVEHHNHYFDMPGAQHTRQIRYKRGIVRGIVSHHRLPATQLAIGRKRDVWLYQPPTIEPVPLLLVYDGEDYYRRGRIHVIVDNLIAQKKMAPVAMAMLDNASELRFAEYHTSESTLYTVMSVYNLAQTYLRLVDIEECPGAYGVMGASLGGLMALFTGLRLYPYFGKVLSQAGAFDITPVPEHPPLISELVRYLPLKPLKVWQDVGTLDWLLQSNRTMKSLLNDQGYDVTYREYSAGHNFTAWRDALPDALTTLFPPR